MISKKLTIIKNNKVYVSTDIIANELDRDYDSIISLVKSYKNELESLGILGFEIQVKSTKNWKIESRGQPKKIYYLNEKQITFLLMNMRSKPNENTKVMELKLKIANEFVDQKELLLDIKSMKNNTEYKEIRSNNKAERKQLTDSIKEFIIYAKANGSKNADRYYTLFTKMENDAFFIKDKKDKFNIREMLDIDQLTKLSVADMIIQKTIYEGIETGIFYKEIYKLSKERVVNLANNIGNRSNLSLV
jgi:hypothetical protein